ncbi:MAG: toxin [Muribaculaceae bacterium]|nr:toxin [Muribaculaceae bacterium]
MGTSKVTKEDVERFLENFYVKVKIFGLRFRDDRGKNLNTLAELEITPRMRETVVMSLKWNDYSDGPIIDELNRGAEMWVFGKDVKGTEVYIKITMGEPNSHTICISFHTAEYPMEYPLKTE